MPDLDIHGLRGYRRGCRCDACRAGRAEYDRQRQPVIRKRRGYASTRSIPLGSVCSIDGCGRDLYSRKGDPDGMCRHHHLSWRKYGDPLVGFRRAFEERVDKSAGPEGCWLWTGGTVANPWGDYGYFHNQYVHRLAYMFAHELDDLPGGMETDHVCHTRLCVNPQHLRLVTSKQNKEHRLGAQSNSISGVRGVIRIGRKFRAVVRHNGKNVYLGMFETLEEAGEAARLKRIELFTHNDLDRRAG